MEDDVEILKSTIKRLCSDIEWLQNELVRVEDYYKELLEQKETECIQLRNELDDFMYIGY